MSSDLSAGEREAYLDRVYLEALLFECAGFGVSILRLNQSLEAPRQPGKQELAFIDIQNALAFAANVAKMLWPRPRKSIAQISKARGERLCALLGIEARDEVLDDRRMRDDHEHLDERLDKWTQGDSLNFVFHIMLSEGAIVGISAEDMFTRYDSQKKIVRFWDHEVNLQELSNSMSRVQKAATAALPEADLRRQAAWAERAGLPPRR